MASYVSSKRCSKFQVLTDPSSLLRHSASPQTPFPARGGSGSRRPYSQPKHYFINRSGCVTIQGRIQHCMPHPSLALPASPPKSEIDELAGALLSILLTPLPQKKQIACPCSSPEHHGAVCSSLSLAALPFLVLSVFEPTPTLKQGQDRSTRTVLNMLLLSRCLCSLSVKHASSALS